MTKGAYYIASHGSQKGHKNSAHALYVGRIPNLTLIIKTARLFSRVSAGYVNEKVVELVKKKFC